MESHCPPRRSKWAWAFVVGCPACAGGAVLALAPLVGLTAAGFKLAAATLAVGLLLGLWVRNAWVRRHEAATEPGSGG